MTATYTCLPTLVDLAVLAGCAQQPTSMADVNAAHGDAFANGTLRASARRLHERGHLTYRESPPPGAGNWRNLYGTTPSGRALLAGAIPILRTIEAAITAGFGK